MLDFSNLKIPIFPRINSVSRPPTETRAANATYLLLRWNQLQDSLNSEFQELRSQLNALASRIDALEQWNRMFSQSFYSDTPNFGVALEPFELGIRIKFVKTGFITAIRFLKPQSETGSHVARIWNSEGNLLRTVPFLNETESGWQNQNLTPAFAVQADTEYIVSVPSNSSWAYLLSPFSTQSKGDLVAIREVYSAQVGTFPETSGNYVDYLRDLAFVPAP